MVILVEMATKKCRGCDEERPVAEFYPEKRNRDGLHSYCRRCASRAKREHYHRNAEELRAKSAAYRKANPDAVKASRRKHYLANRDKILIESTMRRYGLTREQYDDLTSRYGGICPICNRERKLVVDHDHRSGIVRGMLCQECNTRLGWFEVVNIENVTKYLAAGIWS